MAVNNIGDKLFFKDVSGTKYSEGIRKRTTDAYSDSTKEASRSGDTVSLSNNSRDMQIARNALNAAPLNTDEQDLFAGQTRDQRISNLREMYSSGQYLVEPEKIAAKLVGTHFNEIV